MISPAATRFRWLQGAVVALLVGIIAAELLIYSPPIHDVASPEVSIQSVRQDSASTTVQIAITHGYSDQDVRLVAFPLGSRPGSDRSIYVFNDAGFPTAGAVGTAGQGIFDHLAGELAVHHYRSQVVGITANDLAGVFEATNQASTRAVVMMTGILPSNVFSRQIDLLTPWVKAGGLVIWGGGTIGFWSAIGGRPLRANNVVGEAGTVRLLGVGVVKYPTVFGRAGNVQSDFGSALDVSYSFASGGVLRDSVLGRGGIPLGWYSGPYSSVSYLPEGLGGYLIFGGEIPDEMPVAVDVARILISDAIYGIGPVAATTIHLSKTTQNSVLDWSLPFTAPSDGIMLVSFDPASDSTYSDRRIIGS